MNEIMIVSTIASTLSRQTSTNCRSRHLPAKCIQLLLRTALLSCCISFLFSSDTNSTNITVEALNTLSLDIYRNKRILVVGGSGRVGGSCCTHLVLQGAQLVTVGGTNELRFQESYERWKKLFPEASLENVNFKPLDRENPESVRQVLLDQTDLSKKYDLVIHTAGPFQGKVKSRNAVLETCVDIGVPYLDVCDDYCTAMGAKTRYSETAVRNNVPCIVSTGCWPGVSSLMAKQLIHKVEQERPGIDRKDLKVDFSFFTAGSGGAGVTLLVATFLILAEKALTVVNGRRKPVDPMKTYSTVHFGPIIGNKEVANLNLLETASISEVMGIGNVQSLFGTAPGFWNSLLGLMAQLPDDLLANEEIMRKLSIFSLPIVRVVDYFAGATNAMRCDVTSTQDSSFQATAIYGHKNLEPCVGECVAAFGAAILAGEVPSGVSFPEEAINAGEIAAAVLKIASVGAHTTMVSAQGFDINEEEIFGTEG